MQKTKFEMIQSTFCRTNKQRGFSLVEILVGLVIGMFGVAVVLQTMSFSESQKRSTTSGSDAQTSGIVSLMMIERDVMSAGFGAPDIECSQINAFNDTFSPKNFTLSGRPVLIGVDTPSAGSDQITITRGSSALGGIPVTIQNDMPESSAILRVNYGEGFKTGDMVLIAEPPKNCSVAQLTQDGQPTGTGNVSPAIGSQWNLQHNSGASDWNPPGGNNIFPVGGYGAGAQVLNMGQMESIRYYVANGNLMRQDMTSLVQANINPSIVANGVISLKILYGRDTDADGYADIYDATAPASNKEVVSVRIGILLQSMQYMKELISPASIVLWKDGATTGPVINLSADQRHYRYRIYDTIVPIKNIIWNN